jgi:GST-like protein
MIDLYTWTTPNGRKVSILLEELGIDYNVHSINIGKDEQHSPAFLKISPNNKIPAIVDHDTGVSLMESGAIMVYLAEKYGRFLPEGQAARAEVMQWLMWQMGGFGPMAGQAHHFLHFNPGKAAYAEDRFGAEVKRLYSVLDKQLEGRDHICGEYSIADMACWPWVSRYEWQQIDLADYPNVRAWYQRLRAREAVQKGYHVPKVMGEIPEGLNRLPPRGYNVRGNQGIS